MLVTADILIYNFPCIILGRVFVGSIINIRNEFFLGSWGNKSERETKKSSDNHFAVHMICLSNAVIHSPINLKKKHSFLKYYM